ncbi:helix-turn-helix domain-containing protein [Clostridium sporogenes]
MNKISLKFIGKNIKEKRKEKGFNIKELANKLGIAYSTMVNMESGDKKPTIEQLSKIGEILNCDWKDFLYYGDKLVVSVDEMDRLIKEKEERVKAIKNRVNNDIRSSIQSTERLYSPTRTLLSEQDLKDIENLVLHTIKTRLEQISNSKQNEEVI